MTLDPETRAEFERAVEKPDRWPATVRPQDKSEIDLTRLRTSVPRALLEWIAELLERAENPHPQYDRQVDEMLHNTIETMREDIRRAQSLLAVAYLDQPMPDWVNELGKDELRRRQEAISGFTLQR